MSQAANTFWDERLEGFATVAANPVAKRRLRTRRLVDGIILTIILAAAGTCVSVYDRARAELGSAVLKHQAAGEKVQDLSIRVEKLERDVRLLRTDSTVIEQFARQRFGFVRSGDVVIKLAPESNDLAAGATELRPAARTDLRTDVRTGLRSGVRTDVRTEGRTVRVANLTPRGGDGYTDASN